jgi:hypothetical protein
MTMLWLLSQRALYLKEWWTTFSAVDKFEHEDALFLNEHIASVDWNEKRRSINSDILLASSPNSNVYTKLSADAGPFILDSGETIHISPDVADFFNLKPISPRVIQGIGSSSINATSVRKIRLHIVKGCTIILDPAL